ncbi:oligosaccharide flippase family protein [Acinetobacter indicus]|uniref:oligosaccharide flippase family protein n=1 Tax=Acinetobacter indicus TaxID=756892 RepID=UPI0025759DF6|nr:oligosaccharide flippase family protein [Acinetobacter indicus]MDM1263167.1 oligosaccharide flippase family protein [Acinetobacter indicus]
MNLKKILWFALGPIGSIFLGFLTLPIIAWIFNIETVAKISLIMVASNLILLICGLGLDQSYIRDYYKEKNKKKLFFNLIIPGHILYFMLLLVFLVFPNLIEILLFKLDLISRLSIFLILYSVFVMRFLTLDYRMEGDAKIFSFYQIVPKLLYFLFLIIIIILEIDKEFKTLLIAYTLSNLIPALFIIYSYFKRVRINFREFDYHIFFEKIGYAIPFLISGVIYSLFNILDRYALKFLSNLDELGRYSLAVSIAGVTSVVIAVFNTIWAPMVFKKIDEKNEDIDISGNAYNLLKVLMPFYCLLGLSGPAIESLLPSQYNKISEIIIIYVLVPMFYVISEITGVGILVAKRTKWLVMCSFICLLINIFLCFILVPKLGGVGAAISVSMSYLVYLIMKTLISTIVWKSFSYLGILFMAILMFVFSIFNLFIGSFEYFKFIYWLALFFLVFILNRKFYLILFYGLMKYVKN